eukprot:jgi/Tetstr1/450770/TSEL_037806.t1
MSTEFLITALIVCLLPGSGVLYTLAVGLGRGFKASIAAAFGCTLGIIPSALASIVGLAAIFHASALAFQTLKYLGVAYLLYMAWSILRSGGAMGLEADRSPASMAKIATSGALINVLNPKLSLFFLAFLPQFVPLDTPHATATLLLHAAVFMAITFVTFVGSLTNQRDGPMRIATWNINGINARLPAVLTWLDETKPDIVGLQEIKCLDENFPRAEFESRGYNVETHGQKSFNGVALLSKLPFDEVHRGLPGNDEDPSPASSRVSFPLKTARLAHEEPFILMGDFNLIPTGFDCHDPSVWWGDALFRPESLEKWRRIVNLGLTDALRATTSDQVFTFWDFQAGAWRRNAGIRIDHLLLSPQAADRLTGVTVHKDTRGWDKPSDHVPVEGDFTLAGHSAKAA